MSFEQFAQYVFYALLSYTAYDLTKAVKKAQASIEELNVKMAQILEKVSGHEKTLDDHSERIKTIEQAVH